MSNSAVLNPAVQNSAATSTAQTLSTAMRRLASIDPEQPSCFNDLVALNAARNCIDELFKDCSDELRADPETAELWDAMTSAVTLNTKQRPGKNSPGKNSATQPSPQDSPSRSDEQAEMFWESFAGRFTWDFLPVTFLHALYAQWMGEQFPGDMQFSKFALTRRLKSTAAKSGDWFHTRSRPGSLMSKEEPLTQRVPQWKCDEPKAGFYGFRRSGV